MNVQHGAVLRLLSNSSFMSNMVQYYVCYLTAASCPTLLKGPHMTALIQFNLAHSQFPSLKSDIHTLCQLIQFSGILKIFMIH